MMMMSRGNEEMAALPMLSAPVDQMRVGINTMEGSYGSSKHNLQKQVEKVLKIIFSSRISLDLLFFFEVVG